MGASNKNRCPRSAPGTFRDYFEVSGIIFSPSSLRPDSCDFCAFPRKTVFLRGGSKQKKEFPPEPQALFVIILRFRVLFFGLLLSVLTRVIFVHFPAKLFSCAGAASKKRSSPPSPRRFS